ncbi:triphosphoribosyl-dephospho-CoA synthase [Haloplanus aerogenes]|uniref:Triphosphoribosyl-dephospho-CoA synthase n=2 Tax=Haloplanus aerogenes TaxID=660522 RepID=A0A3M0DUJ2_9EURY|nr:triphosphoribosyl-dephospho-CoA synthase [Haloplanus aerogenes]RMB25562.1 triphosphoribosyl-dephospho-CoA synthase [Haloplanus aerogenes]
MTDEERRASNHPRPEMSPADHAELALLLEVASTPKPGNVDRHRDHADLRFEHFLTGAVGSRPGLELAERVEGDDPPSIGDAFDRAVRGMSQQSGGNTQFGCLLLLVPLVRAASTDHLSPEGLTAVVEATTVDDAAAFYRAFEHVDVAVGDPPADASALDVRRGADAVPALRDRGLTLADVMAMSADRDGNAAEWISGFERTFAAADRVVVDDDPLTDRLARAFLDLLAERPDTLVAVEHGQERAKEVSREAAAVRDDLDAAEALAERFLDEGINPGTTADLTAATAFVALERGVRL